MPLQKLQFRPGVNREGTTLANEGGWFECDKVRFRSGFPEKIGGWAAQSYATFTGVCRSLWNWVTLKGYNLLGVGTNSKFYVQDIGGAYYDITPAGLAPGQPIATVGTGWGAGPWSRGGWGSGYTSGFTLQLRLWSQANFGDYLLFSPRGGAVYIWQAGPAATPNFSQPGVKLSSSSVTPSGWTSVVTDSSCPDLVNQIMVSDSSRIVIAFGCNDPSGVYFDVAQDPMLIRWTTQESYAEWIPTATNQAGSYRLSHGSTIVSAIQTRQEILVLTDAAVYSMQYIGAPYVFGFNLLADNISIISPNAVATANGVTYWMGTDKFYVYSGRVETLPCAVRTYVFQDFNRDQAYQCFAGTNEGYSEIWFFYCSISGPNGTGTISNPNTTIDSYVIFNYLDRVWYYGKLGRTAWLDSPLRQYPQAATTGNIMVYHEAAVDDGTTNPPSPISAYVQSSDFDIGDGHNYGFVWQLIPDITFDGSNTSGLTSENPSVRFVVRPRQNPGANYGNADEPTVQSAQNYSSTQTYNVQQFTEIVYTRIRGRQMAFRVESDTLGTQWQLGTPRINVRPDGRR